MRQGTAAANPSPSRPPALSPLLARIGFDAIDGWAEDDHGAALVCFQRSARRMAARPYTTKALGVDGAALARLGALALGVDPAAARTFFETNFTPHRIGAAGFVTGYYEPQVAASPVPTARFGYPLYRRPPDLVDIDDANRPPGWDPDVRFGRHTAAGIAEYFDRAAIEAGALSCRGLELAWIESPVDGFFIHIQGSARLIMPDGTVRRIAYAGKSGHHFTPIGRLLVEAGRLRRDEVSMQAIRDWLNADPERGRELMAKNRSFIFFADIAQPDPALGPVAAASVALSPGLSLAVDHRLHTFGSPVWVATSEPLPEQERPFRRLMVAQDTGSAITGPARGDLFIGSGEAAGRVAGAIRHAADFIVLVPVAQVAS